MPETDGELIARTRQGESAAFGELWERYRRKVLHVCRGYIRALPDDPAIDAEDLLTETFIRVLHCLERYEDRSEENTGFEAWLMEIARNHCLNHLARQRRRTRIWSEGVAGGNLCPPPRPSTDRIVEERHLLRLAAQEINGLPPLYRTPFKLSLEERSHQEIAETLGISVENASKRIQRARRMLQPRIATIFALPPAKESGLRRGSKTLLRNVERCLLVIVGDYRIATIPLPGGGEKQLCLRTERAHADREEEIARMRATLEGRPRVWKRRLELAHICYHCGRWNQAREEYQRVLATNPRCFEAAQSLGGMLLEEHQGREAALVFATALRGEPPPPVAARLEAHRLEALEQWEEAAATYEKAILLAPAEKANYYGLHRTLACLSRYGEQLENLARLSALDPQDIFAFHAAYTPCARLERWDDARHLLEQAVALDPHFPVAIKHLFEVRMNLNLYDEETLRLAEKLVEIAPEFAESWGELAWFYRARGQAAEGVALLHAFLDKHPTNAQAHAFLAWAYHYDRRDDYETTVREHARLAYALSPGDWYVCWTMLMALGDPTDTSRREESCRVADEIAARFPGDAFLLDRVAAVDALWGRPEQAIKRALLGASLDPDSPIALGALGDIYLRLERWEEAAGVYRRVIQLPGGETALLLAHFGLALSHCDPQEAERVWARAWDQAASSSDLLRLALVLEKTDRCEQALRAYRECLAKPVLSTHTRETAEKGLGRLTQLRT
jgi:RNA polymerase sigma factor (sigma-70 family)